MSQITLIKERSEQINIWSRLSQRLTPVFSIRKSAAWNDVFYRANKEDESEFGLEIWLRGDWLGCSLNGPLINDRNRFGSILQFATYSNKSGTDLLAARLASYDGNTVLLHDGRVYSDGRGSPRSENQIEVDGKNFYVVAQLDAEDFFGNLIAFHQSRINPDLNARTSEKKGLVDPGQSQGGVRSLAYFEARHHPITMALLSELKERKFDPIECDVFSPDILVSNGKTRILFEIKPASTGHDLIVGCGQLLIYNQKARAMRLALVTPAIGVSPYANEIRTFMNVNGIVAIEISKEANTFAFNGLDAFLSGA